MNNREADRGNLDPELHVRTEKGEQSTAFNVAPSVHSQSVRCPWDVCAQDYILDAAERAQTLAIENNTLRAENHALNATLQPIRALATVGTNFQNNHVLLAATPEQLASTNPEILIASGKGPAPLTPATQLL